MYYPEATPGNYNHYMQVGTGGFWLYNKDGQLICSSDRGDVLMQYTGLNDKNGREIYEGDIIRFAEKYVYIVKYEDAKFVGYHANNDWGKWGDLYKIAEPEFSKYGYSVIGNLYNNPELVNPASGQSSVNHMQDPNTQQQEAAGQAEAANEQATTEQIAAVEQEAQEQAMDSAEEGTTEG